MLIPERKLKLMSAAITGLATSMLSPEQIAIRAMNIADACLRELELREDACFAGEKGEAARKTLADRRAHAGVV